MNLDDVRKLELRYSRRTPGKAGLLVEHVGGRIKVFEVDRFFTLRQLLGFREINYLRCIRSVLVRDYLTR